MSPRSRASKPADPITVPTSAVQARGFASPLVTSEVPSELAHSFPLTEATPGPEALAEIERSPTPAGTNTGATSGLAGQQVAQLRFADEAAATLAPTPPGWTAGTAANIAGRDGAIYQHEYVDAVSPILWDLPIYYQDNHDYDAGSDIRSYLVPVVDPAPATDDRDAIVHSAPEGAFWARFEGSEFRGYLQLDSVARAWTYDYVSSAGNPFDGDGEDATVEGLIANFTISSVSEDEVGAPHDAVGRLPGDNSNRPGRRIDRQGPAMNGSAARFAVQIGGPIFAGVIMPHSIDFPLDTVKDAFRESITYGTYALLRRV